MFIFNAKYRKNDSIDSIPNSDIMTPSFDKGKFTLWIRLTVIHLIVLLTKLWNNRVYVRTKNVTKFYELTTLDFDLSLSLLSFQ